MECPPNAACESEAWTCPKAFWRATLLGGGPAATGATNLATPPFSEQKTEAGKIRKGKAEETRAGAGEMNKEGRESTWLWA